MVKAPAYAIRSQSQKQDQVANDVNDVIMMVEYRLMQSGPDPQLEHTVEIHVRIHQSHNTCSYYAHTTNPRL